MRRVARSLATVLIVTGALLLADGAATLVWEEPVTSLYAGAQQRRLGDRLAQLERAGPPAVERKALARVRDRDRRLRFAARAAARRVRAGEPVGRLRADAVGLDEVVVQGTDAETLHKGPGHYPGTPLPGARGTVAIAGHRTTYGAPFRDVDALERGNRIELSTPYGRFGYRVERTRVVAPAATSVIRRVAYDRLVLTACHPRFSAARRIVVFARLERALPRFGS
jgi:sortase A